MASKTQRRITPWGEDNPERDRKGGLGQLRAATDLINPVGMLDQLLGKYPKEAPGQSPTKENAPKKKSSEVVLYAFKERTEQSQLSNEIRAVLQTLSEQITLLEKSESGLAKDIAKLEVEQLPEKPGIYYIRFFEWLTIMVKQLRAKVEEGRTWLQAMTTKKKKMGYWKMYKKHGTTFGLSNERTVATQSG